MKCWVGLLMLHLFSFRSPLPTQLFNFSLLFFFDLSFFRQYAQKKNTKSRRIRNRVEILPNFNHGVFSYFFFAFPRQNCIVCLKIGLVAAGNKIDSGCVHREDTRYFFAMESLSLKEILRRLSSHSQALSFKIHVRQCVVVMPSNVF